MDCKDYEGLLVAYVKGELSQDDATVVEEHIKRCHSCRWNAAAARQSLTEIEEVMAEDSPVEEIVKTILTKAIEERASDVHIEPDTSPERGKHVRVRYRIDGALHNVMPLPDYCGPPLATRFAIMADLNPFEKRLPQSGHIAIAHEGWTYDMRVATLPTWRGQRVVLRVMRPGGQPLELDNLGLSETNLSRLKGVCRQPSGIFLVCGPVGSGRTTLLYAMLRRLNREGVSVLTVEDPAEMEIPGVSQTHLNRTMGLDYPAALKAIMQQDPDIVMCGDVPDQATADMLCHIAMTGHLVLAPVTGTDAANGVAAFLEHCSHGLLAARVLIGAAGIRLVRVVCDACAQTVEPSASDARFLSESGVDSAPPEVKRSAGCEKCRHTGYFGRTGIHEVLMVDDDLREQLSLGDGEVDVARCRVNPPIARDAAEKAATGVTTVDEAARVVGAILTGST